MHYDVNVKGVFHSYRAAARVMIPSGYGRIIGACSTAAKPSKYLVDFDYKSDYNFICYSQLLQPLERIA